MKSLPVPQKRGLCVKRSSLHPTDSENRGPVSSPSPRRHPTSSCEGVRLCHRLDFGAAGGFAAAGWPAVRLPQRTALLLAALLAAIGETRTSLGKCGVSSVPELHIGWRSEHLVTSTPPLTTRISDRRRPLDSVTDLGQHMRSLLGVGRVVSPPSAPGTRCSSSSCSRPACRAAPRRTPETIADRQSNVRVQS